MRIKKSSDVIFDQQDSELPERPRCSSMIKYANLAYQDLSSFLQLAEIDFVWTLSWSPPWDTHRPFLVDKWAIRSWMTHWEKCGCEASGNVSLEFHIFLHPVFYVLLAVRNWRTFDNATGRQALCKGPCQAICEFLPNVQGYVAPSRCQQTMRIFLFFTMSHWEMFELAHKTNSDEFNND